MKLLLTIIFLSVPLLAKAETQLEITFDHAQSYANKRYTGIDVAITNRTDKHFLIKFAMSIVNKNNELLNTISVFGSDRFELSSNQTRTKQMIVGYPLKKLDGGSIRVSTNIISILYLNDNGEGLDGDSINYLNVNAISHVKSDRLSFFWVDDNQNILSAIPYIQSSNPQPEEILEFDPIDFNGIASNQQIQLTDEEKANRRVLAFTHYAITLPENWSKDYHDLIPDKGIEEVHFARDDKKFIIKITTKVVKNKFNNIESIIPKIKESFNNKKNCVLYEEINFTFQNFNTKYLNFDYLLNDNVSSKGKIIIFIKNNTFYMIQTICQPEDFNDNLYKVTMPILNSIRFQIFNPLLNITDNDRNYNSVPQVNNAFTLNCLSSIDIHDYIMWSKTNDEILIHTKKDIVLSGILIPQNTTVKFYSNGIIKAIDSIGNNVYIHGIYLKKNSSVGFNPSGILKHFTIPIGQSLIVDGIEYPEDTFIEYDDQHNITKIHHGQDHVSVVISGEKSN